MDKIRLNRFTMMLQLVSVILLVVAATLSSCKKDPSYRYQYKGDRLSFSVVEYNADSDTWHDRSLAKETKDTVMTRAMPDNSLSDVITLQGERPSDTLFLHVSVTDNINAESAGDRRAGLNEDMNRITKAQPVVTANFYDSFGVFASTYTGSWNNSLLPNYMHNVEVTKSSNWTTTYLWPKAGGSKMRFFAYAPYNGNGISLSDSKLPGEPTLNYTVPQKVEEQADILVAASSEMDCSAKKPVRLPFRHIMSAIKFVVGDDAVAGIIKSVSLKGVFNGGESNIGEAPVWKLRTDRSNYTLNLNLSISGSAGEPITSAVQTFMMMPQTLPEGAVIEVVYNDGTDHILKADIAGSRWESGKTYTYKVSNSSVTWEPVLEINRDVNLTYKGGTTSFNILSYKENTKGAQEPVSWIAEFSTDGGATWVSSAPSWLSGFPTSGSGSLDVVFFNNVEMAANDEEVISFDDLLKKADDVGEHYNLSNRVGSPLIENTANCYIINAPGNYILPLVYGNGVTDYMPNTAAYESSSNGSGILKTFVNHLGAEITSPFIFENENCYPQDAVLLWQDEKDLVTNVKLAQDGTAMLFDVKRENIKQGNAVVAVRDADMKIMWSWHIWVTPYIANLAEDKDDALRDKVVTNRNNQKYTMMPFNLGWFCKDAMLYPQRKVQVRITQQGTKNAKTGTVTYTQTAGVNMAGNNSIRGGSNTFYQWGRKDALLPAYPPNGNKVWYDTEGNSHNVIEAGDWSTDGIEFITSSILNPHVFNNKAAQHMLYYNMWSTNNTGSDKGVTTVVKTIYDPSPVGYCVPPPAAFSGLSYTGEYVTSLSDMNVEADFKAGFNAYCNRMKDDKTKDPSGGFISFPAPGLRSSGGKQVSTVDGAGFYWTAIPSSSGKESMAMSVIVGGVVPNFNYNRIYGLAIRSVKEQ